MLEPNIHRALLEKACRCLHMTHWKPVDRSTPFDRYWYCIHCGGWNTPCAPRESLFHTKEVRREYE
jgi:hypothetical protein